MADAQSDAELSLAVAALVAEVERQRELVGRLAEESRAIREQMRENGKARKALAPPPDDVG